MIDATCPAIHTMLQAAEKGVPFMPLRGVHRQRHPGAPAGLEGDRQPVRRHGDDPILLLPALSPDIAVFHARLRRRATATSGSAAGANCATIAHASRGRW